MSEPTKVKESADEHADDWAASRCSSCGQQMRASDWADRILSENDMLRRKGAQTQKLWAASSDRNSKLESERNHLRERVAELEGALRDLLDRVDRNGGLGEYKGGVPFATKTARELLAKVSK